MRTLFRFFGIIGVESDCYIQTKSFTDYLEIHFFWYNYNVEAHFLGLLCIFRSEDSFVFFKVLLRKAQSLTPTIGFFQKIRIIYRERENKNVLGYLLRGTP